MGDIGLTNFNFVRENTKSQILAILDPKSFDFDKLYLHQDHVGTCGDIIRDRHWHVMRADVHGSCERVRLSVSAPDTNAFEIRIFFLS
jgi:hypothetical protein